MTREEALEVQAAHACGMTPAQRAQAFALFTDGVDPEERAALVASVVGGSHEVLLRVLPHADEVVGAENVTEEDAQALLEALEEWAGYLEAERVLEEEEREEEASETEIYRIWYADSYGPEYWNTSSASRAAMLSTADTLRPARVWVRVQRWIEGAWVDVLHRSEVTK